jgi:hypothetical protein
MALVGLAGVDGSKQCPPETTWMRLRIWLALHYCCRWDIAKYTFFIVNSPLSIYPHQVHGYSRVR